MSFQSSSCDTKLAIVTGVSFIVNRCLHISHDTADIPYVIKSVTKHKLRHLEQLAPIT